VKLKEWEAVRVYIQNQDMVDSFQSCNHVVEAGTMDNQMEVEVPNNNQEGAEYQEGSVYDFPLETIVHCRGFPKQLVVVHIWLS
jgi:hypothetical protein